MAKVLVVVTKPELEGVGPDPGAQATRLSLGRLDVLARRRHVEPLSSYVSRSPDELLDLPGAEDPDESEMGAQPVDAWFDPAGPLATIQALLQEIVEGSVSFAMATAISVELTGIEDRLVAAQKAGAQVRLEPRD